MTKGKRPSDPRGHSLRIYSDVYDSPAFAALTPPDVMAYLALLRELKGYNNGDLSLPLSRAKLCGIRHPKTLARSLRALCAVGLVAVARKGGCTKGGQRLPTLYRMTDRECHAIPAKHLEAMKETNEWKRVATVEQAQALIAGAEATTKKTKSLVHAVPLTMAPGEPVEPKTMAPREPWDDGLGHAVNMVEKAANPVSMRATAEFCTAPEKASHRAPRSTPLYVATPQGDLGAAGCYRRLTCRPAALFTGLLTTTH